MCCMCSSAWQAPHAPALVTVEVPLAADIVGCPGKRVNDGPPDDRFGDFAPIAVQESQPDDHVGALFFLADCRWLPVSSPIGAIAAVMCSERPFGR